MAQHGQQLPRYVDQLHSLGLHHRSSLRRDVKDGREPLGGSYQVCQTLAPMGMVLLAFPEFSIFRDRVLIYVLMRWCVYVWLIDFFVSLACVMCWGSRAQRVREKVWWLVCFWIYSCPSMPWYNMIQLKTMDYLQMHDDTYYMWHRSRRWILRYEHLHSSLDASSLLYFAVTYHL